jgi:hypothetical protein
LVIRLGKKNALPSWLRDYFEGIVYTAEPKEAQAATYAA